MAEKILVKNKKGEGLDTLIEGKKDSDITIIFVHGFGTDKHETAHYFDDIANSLKNDYRIVRFDFSGNGKSDGKQEDWDYQKGAYDLQSVIDWVRKQYKGKIYILAQSMGTFVTSLLSPDNIDKIVFTGIPNSNTQYMINTFPKRFLSRPGAVLNKDGISLFPRSSGQITRIGPSFWSELAKLNPVEKVTILNNKTRLLIFRPMHDDVIGNEFMEEYKLIPNINIIELPGDHSFSKTEDRKELIRRIKKFLLG